LILNNYGKLEKHLLLIPRNGILLFRISHCSNFCELCMAIFSRRTYWNLHFIIGIWIIKVVFFDVFKLIAGLASMGNQNNDEQNNQS